MWIFGFELPSVQLSIHIKKFEVQFHRSSSRPISCNILHCHLCVFSQGIVKFYTAHIFFCFLCLSAVIPGEIKMTMKRTFLPASSCDDVRSSSSRCCCARSLSVSVRRSRSSSSSLVKFSSLVSFSRLSLSDASFSAASLCSAAPQRITITMARPASTKVAKRGKYKLK